MEPNAMDSQRRLMLALGITLVMTMLYMTFFAPPPPPEPEVGAAADGGVTAPIAQAPRPDLAPAEVGPVEDPAWAPPPEVTVRRANPQLHLSFASRGAGIVQAELQGEKAREQQVIGFQEGLRRVFGARGEPAPQVDMATPVVGEPLPLAVAVRGERAVSADAAYRVEEEGRDLVFTTVQDGLEVVKRFHLPGQGYPFTMAVSVRNLADRPFEGELEVHYARGVDPEVEQSASFLGGMGNESKATCAVDDDIHDLAPGKEAAQEFGGSVHYFGINQQYFLGTVFSLDGPQAGRCVLSATATGRRAVGVFPLRLAPGAQVTERYGVFVGPKDTYLLAEVPQRMESLGLTQSAPSTGWAQESAYPHLEKTVDFGLLAVICHLLLWIMRFFHALIGNWGLAIVFLTVTVKVVLLPLTHKSMVAAEQMKKLQPQMEEIRKKFAQDRERMNQEIMKLYQERKVNPLGGCLPLLLQMPVWFALFTTLRNSFELYREPFISPIWVDLTAKDPIYLFPVALGATWVVTQKLQPQVMDPVQAKIFTYVMPVFFTVVMLAYPAGLTLYIFTNNVLTIGQQYGLRKYLEKKGLAAPRALGPTKPTKPSDAEKGGRREKKARRV